MNVIATPSAAASHGRLAALALRHETLESLIAHEQARPAPDMGALQRLKRTKLRIKQELYRLNR